MCGHGSIGVATVAIETGMIESKQPVTEILIDTPAGTIRPRVNVENGRAKSVTLEIFPLFYIKQRLFRFQILVNCNDIAMVEMSLQLWKQNTWGQSGCGWD